MTTPVYPRWRPRKRRQRFIVVDYPANRLLAVRGMIVAEGEMPPTEEALKERVKGNFLIRKLSL